MAACPSRVAIVVRDPAVRGHSDVPDALARARLLEALLLGVEESAPARCGVPEDETRAPEPVGSVGKVRDRTPRQREVLHRQIGEDRGGRCERGCRTRDRECRHDIETTQVSRGRDMR